MIKNIVDKFNLNGNLVDYNVINSGIINNTYVITMNDNGKIRKYIVQKINTTVFTEPYKLMKNIEGITTYLKRQLDKEQDFNHKVLELKKTKEGKTLCYMEEHGERDYYRIYDYIDNAVTYDCSIDKNIVYNTGKAFGAFQRLLRNYPMSKLSETIKDFHMTNKRYKKLIEDIKIDSEGRVMEVANEIVFILMREEVCSLITDLLGTDDIPYRVTHNDTKVNNVMMNKDTGDYLAVIDLDTVMPGSLLFDYGDGIRSTASTAKEDEIDLNKVGINLDLFEAYTDGYLSEMSSYITYEEVSLMAESVRVITLELAIRFLNDYINGDTYFKTDYEKHNLDRTRNQLALVLDIEKKLDYMNEYIMNTFQKYKKNNNGKVLIKK